MELCPTGPLYLEVGNGIQSVVERLSQKTTSRATSAIDSVVLRGRFCRFIDTHVSPDEINDVLRMASCLPNLRRLCFLRMRVPVSAITDILHVASRSGIGGGLNLLEELELRSIVLSGSLEDMRDLGFALEQHTTLKKIALADCRPESSESMGHEINMNENHYLDSVITALGKMVSLTQVEFDMMELSRWLQSTTSFQKFISGGHLKRLSLSYMRVPEDYILSMADALSCHDPLSSVEEVCFDRCDSLSKQSTFVMSEMLRRNTSLTKLKLVVKDYDDAIPIAQALTYNTCSGLKHLFLRTYSHLHNSIGHNVYQAFKTMLEHNFTIEYLEMFQGHPMRPILALDPALNFYLKINRAGRNKLLSLQRQSISTEASNDEWARVIIASRLDVQCTYYFLSQNPSICQVSY